MAYEVRVTGPAKDDIWRNYRWWGEHRSVEQAVRWFVEIDELVSSLSHSADRHPLATETPLRLIGVRQVSFGIGRRLTHRILYGLDGEVVIVYRVRSFKQDAIGPEQLEG